MREPQAGLCLPSKQAPRIPSKRLAGPTQHDATYTFECSTQRPSRRSDHRRAPSIWLMLRLHLPPISHLQLHRSFLPTRLLLRRLAVHHHLGAHQAHHHLVAFPSYPYPLGTRPGGVSFDTMSGSSTCCQAAAPERRPLGIAHWRPMCRNAPISPVAGNKSSATGLVDSPSLNSTSSTSPWRPSRRFLKPEKASPKAGHSKGWVCTFPYVSTLLTHIF